MIVPFYKGKRECKNHGGIRVLNVGGKIYAEILVDRVRRVTGGLTIDEQGDLEQGMGV